MAENDKASRMAKLKAILNADAAIITILLAVGGGIIHVTNQIAALQTTSDQHTKQIDDVNAAHSKIDAKVDWMLRQLDLIRMQTNAPTPQARPAPAWPPTPEANEGLTGKAAPKKNGMSSLFPQVEISRKAPSQQLAGGVLNPDQK